MSVGKKIKQLRELRNYTQQYLADRLWLSINGYGKLERDETDISLKRLNQIAEILETDLATILNFDSKQVFNQYNNHNAIANGVVQNQQVIAEKAVERIFTNLENELKKIKVELDNLKRAQWEKV